MFMERNVHARMRAACVPGNMSLRDNGTMRASASASKSDSKSKSKRESEKTRASESKLQRQRGGARMRTREFVQMSVRDSERANRTQQERESARARV
mmetsp:Transcript_56674/g.83173  ORF Transcript_56674/g.83173 Transcript_56674/m.83173 type:complete len:97 (-) Transcript_56674:565-855(-)